MSFLGVSIVCGAALSAEPLLLLLEHLVVLRVVDVGVVSGHVGHELVVRDRRQEELGRRLGVERDHVLHDGRLREDDVRHSDPDLVLWVPQPEDGRTI